MKKAFDGFDEGLIVTSVSPWLMERAKQSPILRGKNHSVVYNGLDTNVFHPYDTVDLREKHHCQGKKVVFHATPAFSADPNHLKGGYYILELAKKTPEVQFIVAGNCVGRIEAPPNVILLGQLTDQVLLARYYSMADVTVITSKKETFSMIVAESLCCGTPVVGFEAGAPEQIAVAAYTSFAPFADTSRLRNNMLATLGRSVNPNEIADVCKDVYACNTMVQKYEKIYSSF